MDSPWNLTDFDPPQENVKIIQTKIDIEKKTFFDFLVIIFI
jgi:hypothetical protein